jgi:hypothetical protein
MHTLTLGFSLIAGAFFYHAFFKVLLIESAFRNKYFKREVMATICSGCTDVPVGSDMTRGEYRSVFGRSIFA